MYAKEIVEGTGESLGEAEIARPKRTIQDIWATGKRLMPDVFGGKAYDGGRGNHAYRTYRQDRITNPKRKTDLYEWCGKMGVEPVRPEKPQLEPEKPPPPIEKPPVEKPPVKPPVKPVEKPPTKLPAPPEEPPEEPEKPDPPEIDWGEVEISIRPPKEPKKKPEKIEAEFEPEPEPEPSEEEEFPEIEMD